MLTVLMIIPYSFGNSRAFRQEKATKGIWTGKEEHKLLTEAMVLYIEDL